MLLKEEEKEGCTHRGRSHREAGGQAWSRLGEPGAGKGMVAVRQEGDTNLGTVSFGSSSPALRTLQKC